MAEALGTGATARGLARGPEGINTPRAGKARGEPCGAKFQPFALYVNERGVICGRADLGFGSGWRTQKPL